MQTPVPFPAGGISDPSAVTGSATHIGTAPSIERYEVLTELGRGGMAVAHEVRDRVSGDRMALKSLLPCEEMHAAVLRALFETEYHSLSQLVHPRIVQTYDYGHDAENRPYYTMELLDGGDLRQLAPLPFDRVCAMMADICSGLSLVHSRRLLHRDLTPRNVRCTRDGKAKLIDFGAVTTFGPSKRIVGTPPYCPPEAVSGQDLDGRSDLYALGATAYFALTGRHAFPARTFTELKQLWSTAIRPPSAYDASIPKELDQLVISLLQLNRRNRPENAAEVIERLSAIADFDSSEQPIITRAYLAAPNLVNRRSSLQRVRKAAVSAVEGHGKSLLIASDSGMGRSRFLAACALEGKLLGATVIRIDATDAGSGAFSASRALLAQLLDAMPESFSLVSEDDAQVLVSLSTPLILKHGDGDRSAAQSALLNIIHAYAPRRPLIITVDDLDMLDEPSQAFFALLAQDAHRRPLLIVASAHEDSISRARDALRVFKSSSQCMHLGPVSEMGTHELLGSIVGRVDRLPALAEHLYNITQGVPAHIMHLAEQLVEAGHLTYRAGEWNISPEAPRIELSKSLSEALSSKINALSPADLRIAQLMALAPGRAFSARELSLNSNQEHRAPVRKALDHLLAEDIVGTDGTRFRLQHRSMQSPLLGSIGSARKIELHKHLAQLFACCGDQGTRTFYHLALAGEMASALQQVLRLAQHADANSGSAPDTMDLGTSRPDDIQTVLESLLKFCEKSRRSRRDTFTVRTTLVAHCSLSTGTVVEHTCAVLEQLRHDSGLDIYNEIKGTVPEKELLRKTFAAAESRYKSPAEKQCVLAPVEAVKLLARTLVQSLAIFGARFDYDLLARAPSLAPFVSLSPALEAIHKNATASQHLLGGRYGPAKALWLEVIERLERGDKAHLPESRFHYMRLAIYYALGSLDGGLSRACSLDNLHLLDADPVFQVNAELLRMNYAFRCGNIESALEHKARAELLRLKNTSPQMFADSHLYSEAMSYMIIRDTRRLNRVLPELKDAATRMPGWKPVLHVAQGSYLGFRKRYDSALGEFNYALHLTAAGHHLVWPSAAAGLIHALRQQNRAKEACQRGEVFLRDAIDAELEHANTIREALALAQSAAGNQEVARTTIDAAIVGWQGIGASGPLLGAAFETAALIAMAQGDLDAFARYAKQCGSLFSNGGNPILTARHDSLLRKADSKHGAATRSTARD